MTVWTAALTAEGKIFGGMLWWVLHVWWVGWIFVMRWWAVLGWRTARLTRGRVVAVGEWVVGAHGFEGGDEFPEGVALIVEVTDVGHDCYCVRGC